MLIKTKTIKISPRIVDKMIYNVNEPNDGLHTLKRTNSNTVQFLKVAKINKIKKYVIDGTYIMIPNTCEG